MGSQQAIFASVATLVLGANEEDSRNLSEEEILQELKRESNLEEAKKFRMKNAVVDQRNDEGNPKLYSIWSTSPEKLGKYGVGLELYFLFLKQMAFLFFITACISIYPAYTNSSGDIIADDESQSGSRYTLANPWWFKRDQDEFLDTDISNNTCLPWEDNNCNNHSRSFNSMEDWKSETLDDINENYKEIWIIDAIYSWIFLLGIIAILIWNKIKIYHNTLGQSRVSDYSIEVAGFPNENIDKEEIKHHFIRFGEIVDVYIGRSYGDLLYFYKERATILKEIRTQKIFLGLGDDLEIESNNKKLRKLQNKLSKLNENITISSFGKFHNELPIYKAYIIFNSKRSRAQALTEYRKGFFGWRHNRSTDLKFREKYQLKVYPGSEPSDVMWENLELKRCERRSRIIVSIFIAVIMMSVSVGLIFLMRRGSESVYDAYKCLNNEQDYGKISIEYVLTHTKWGQDSKERACWCSKQPAKEWLEKPEIRSICLHYVYNRLSSATINFFICFGIVIINFILRLLLTTLSEFERRKSYNVRQTHTMLKIFVAMLFNTILAPILVHVKYGNDEGASELVENQFRDFTKLWYLRVGSMFFIMMCISIVSPHFIFNFLVNYMRGLWKRVNGYKFYKSQYQMHNAFIGPIFVIATRTSMILTVIFTCFIFSGGIPLLNIIGFLALFVIYWTDKFLILRHYRRPPEYNHHIYSSAIKAMPLCVFFHSCVSLYAYGCPNVFPKSFVEDTFTKTFPYLDYKTEDLGDRIAMDHGITFLILAVVSFILFVLFEFSEKITREVKRRLLLKDNDDKTDRFMDIEEGMKRYTLTRYDLELNPNYSYLIDSMNQDVEEGRFVLRKMKTFEKLRNLENGITSLSEDSRRVNHEDNMIRTSPDKKIELFEPIPVVYSDPTARVPTFQSKPPSINLNFEHDAELNEKDATSTSPNRRAPKFEVQNTSLKSFSSDESGDSNSGMYE